MGNWLLMLLLSVYWTKGHKGTVVFSRLEVSSFSDVARLLTGLLRSQLTGGLLGPLLGEALVLWVTRSMTVGAD